MEQIQITQCPKCDTTFRITPSQLKAAKGAVRCGACLHVFRASEHFQKNAEPAIKQQDDRTHDMFNSDSASPSKQVASSTEKRVADDNLFQTNNDALSEAHDDLVSDTSADEGLFDDNAGLPDEKPNNDTSSKYNLIDDSGLIDDNYGLNNDSSTLIDDNSGLIDDDSGLIDDDSGLIDDNSTLIDDDNGMFDDNGYLGDQPKAPVFNEDFLSLNDQNNSDPFFTDGEKHSEDVDKTEEEDEAWAQALLDEPDESTPAKKTSKPVSKAPIEPKLASKVSASKPSFSYIDEDPLDLSLPQKAQKRQKLIWVSACILLAMGLLLQASYFNFNQWARQDSFRPYYQIACEYLKCNLPSTYDLASIRTTASPQVSTHPRFKDALIVDVLFINGAAFTQKFPKLSLTFSDKNDKVVAHRIFNAREYLAGEAAGLTQMPMQTPIHIALEIADPGPSANNYHVRFLQP